MANRVKHHIKTHCKRGHDISVTGRYVNGACIACGKEDTIKLRKGPRPKVQFCPKGHDTFECGRDKKGYCKLCAKKPHKERPKKTFCVNGHESAIVGREKGGACKKCKTDWQRARRAKEKLVPKIKLCKQGHNLDVVGRTKEHRCVICFTKYHLEYAETHVEEIKKRGKEYQMRNKLKLKQYLRKYNLKSHYNMTVEDWDNMFKEQESRCVGCLRHQDEVKKVFGVDHDHRCCPGGRSCGKCVRGLLCDDCNNLLGRAKDNIDTLLRLADYLAKFKI